MKFFKKQWGNILFFLLLALLIFPQSRVPIQIFLQRMVSFSPSETGEGEQEKLTDYNWGLTKIDSVAIHFSRSKDKVAVVNFWATWCPPCVAEMPSFQKLYNDYGNKIDFYFVTSENPKKVKKFMDENEYSLPIYFETSEAPKLLKSNVLPTTYLISKSGKIVVNEEGAANWYSSKMKVIVEKLLSE